MNARAFEICIAPWVAAEVANDPEVIALMERGQTELDRLCAEHAEAKAAQPTLPGIDAA